MLLLNIRVIDAIFHSVSVLLIHVQLLAGGSS